MPLVFTKSEIRQQLCEIGFEPNDEQLKSFVRDLKRLIKAEETKRRERKETVDAAGVSTNIGGIGYSNPSTSSPASQSQSMSTEQITTFSTTTNTSASTSASRNRDPSSGTSGVDQVDVRPPPPDASRTKKTLRKTSTASTRQVLQDKTNSKNVNLPDGKIPVKKHPISRSKSNGNARQQERNLHIPAVEVSAQDTTQQRQLSSSTSTPSTYSSSFEIDLDELDLDSSSGSDDGFNRPRVRLPPKSVRHDPVALYHFYKAIWDRQKGPGEDPRMQLRWNVRAGTLGRVPCDPNGVPTKYLR